MQDTRELKKARRANSTSELVRAGKLLRLATPRILSKY